MHALADITATRSQNLLAHPFGVDAGARQRGARPGGVDLDRRVAPRQRGPARAAAVVRAGLRAPFDGVITARNTDVGALVDAGASARQGLFRLGAIQKLRVYVPVPEAQSRAAVDRPEGRRSRSTSFPGAVCRHRRPQRQRDRRRVAHAARRSGRRQSQGAAPAGRLRAGPLSAAGRGAVGHDSGQHAAVSRRGSARRRRSRRPRDV